MKAQTAFELLQTTNTRMLDKLIHKQVNTNPSKRTNSPIGIVRFTPVLFSKEATQESWESVFQNSLPGRIHQRKKVVDIVNSETKSLCQSMVI